MIIENDKRDRRRIFFTDRTIGCYAVVVFFISGNGFAVPEPRMRLGEGRKPVAGHGRVRRSELYN